MTPSLVATRLLVVDDSPVSLEELAYVLGEAGYDVIQAHDGKTAIGLAQTHSPDLILLDVLMPDMDGFTTCQRLKADAATATIPVLFMTALSDTTHKLSGFAAGAVDYITKPFQHEEILARVRTHLAVQQLSRELREKEQRLSLILANALDAIITLAADGCITFFNTAAESMFRCRDRDVLGESVDRLLSPALRKVLRDYRDTNTLHPGVEPSMWVPEGLNAIRSNGEAFPVEATVSYVQATGTAIYTVIFRDLNERKARLQAEAECQQLRGLNRYLQDEMRSTGDSEELVGSSSSLKHVLQLVGHVAGTDATVLITGETGTGKEVVARALHQRSTRSKKAFIKLNCATIPRDLAESELFGHEKGAFTGALARKVGRFELADGGTLFLDEIGELPLELQAKLLRVLQEGEFERVGGTQTLKCDVRVLAATHRDLALWSQEGRFRADLYYRLNVFPIPLPALRERQDDIPLLARHFIEHYAKKFGKHIDGLPNQLMVALQGYPWPGNIRELQHVIERAVILTQGSTLAPVDWINPVNLNTPTTATRFLTLDEAERQHILSVLDATRWRIGGAGGAAEILSVPPTTLRSRMERLGIKKPQGG